MNIIDIKPRGFCKGVARSIHLAKQTRLFNPEQTITIVGQLVHNRFVVEALRQYQIETVNDPNKSRLELLDQIDEGIVIFSAHGIANHVIEAATAKGLEVVNATCVDVVKTHDLVAKYLSNHYQIIYIGKKGHPETVAIQENYDVHMVENEHDIEDLNLISDKILVTNQTTLSLLAIHPLFDKILSLYPSATIANELCMATTLRQQAIIKQSALDALIVVGDPHSNNTSMLATVASDSGVKHVFKIESIEDLHVSWFEASWTVGITSGASTPAYLTNQVSEYMKKLDLDNPAPLPRVNLSLVLD